VAKKLAKFDSSKHPRGSKGRFVETPDQPKTAKKPLLKATVYQTEDGKRKLTITGLTLKQKQKLLAEFVAADARIKAERLKQEAEAKTKASSATPQVDDQKAIKQARLGLLGAMSAAQRRKLASILVEKAKAKAEKEAKAKAEAEAVASVVAKAVDKVVAKTLAEAKAKTKRPKLTPEEKAAKEAKKAEEKAARETKRAEDKEALAKPATVAPVKKVEALRKLLEVNYKDTPDLEYTPKYKLNDEGLPKLPTAGRAHPPAKKSRIDISDKGLEVWRDQPQYGKMQGKWKDIKDYEYKAELGAKVTVLNKNKLSVTFEGERVYGIPSIHTHLRETTDQKLFSDMARYVSYVENSGKVPPPALSWVKTRHGIIYSDLVGYNKKPGEYGVCELHHHEQWTRRKFTEITDKLTYNEKTKRFEDGEISVEEARRQMKELVEPMTEGGKDYLRIKIQDQGDRSVVVLPAGAHNATSKMYEALHPLGITLDGEPKRVKYGIPDTGEYGRETWFNGWNKRFWTEYYRREVYIMRQEIVRRMQKGDITQDQAEQYWKSGIESVTSTYKYKKYQSDNNTSIRKAIIQDFLTKRDTETA
jgi:hypothetical protein